MQKMAIMMASLWKLLLFKQSSYDRKAFAILTWLSVAFYLFVYIAVIKF